MSSYKPGQVFFNQDNLVWHDISMEVEREYFFPSGESILVTSPTRLNVSASGGHRIITADNKAVYVRPAESWAISWSIK